MYCRLSTWTSPQELHGHQEASPWPSPFSKIEHWFHVISRLQQPSSSPAGLIRTNLRELCRCSMKICRTKTRRLQRIQEHWLTKTMDPVWRLTCWLLINESHNQDLTPWWISPSDDATEVVEKTCPLNGTVQTTPARLPQACREKSDFLILLVTSLPTTPLRPPPRYHNDFRTCRKISLPTSPRSHYRLPHANHDGAKR